MEINPIVVGDCSGRIDRMVCYRVEDRCFARKRSTRKKKEEEATRLATSITAAIPEALSFAPGNI